MEGAALTDYDGWVVLLRRCVCGVRDCSLVLLHSQHCRLLGFRQLCAGGFSARCPGLIFYLLGWRVAAGDHSWRVENMVTIQ